MINIQASKTMTSNSGVEKNTIRMPEHVRKELNLSLGEFVVIRDLALQVDKALYCDTIVNPNGIFVTKDNCNILDVNSIIPSKQITIGCDPEYFIIDTTKNKVFNPSILFKKWGNIGYDGLLGELRPIYSVEVDVVVENIRCMIEDAGKVISERGLAMVAASFGWGISAGFHVHLGIPKILSNNKLVNCSEVILAIVEVLDYYVGTICVAAERDSDYMRRCNNNCIYGKASDYRIDNRTLEYRVPGGSMLKHPYYTAGLLSACSLVVHDVIERLNVCTKGFAVELVDRHEILSDIYENIITGKEMYDILISPDDKAAKRLLPTIRNDMSNMLNYGRYKHNIENMLRLDEPIENRDIINNWLR